MNVKVIGRCSNCGGEVTLPTIWMGTRPPKASCTRCHAVQSNADLPIIPMSKPVLPTFPTIENIGKWISTKPIKSKFSQ